MFNITLYNIVNGAGWESAGTSLGSAAAIASGSVMAARLGIVGLFFLIAIIRKWGGEEIDVEFSFLWSLVLGLGIYLLLITLFGSTKIAFIGGLVGSLIGGYGTGFLFGDGD